MPDDLERAIVAHMKQVYGIAIGEQMIEQLMGPLAATAAIEVRGRDLTSARPRTVLVAPHEIREALGRDGRE